MRLPTPSLPTGVVGASPGLPGVDMQLSINAQGRLQTEEEFGDIIVKTGSDGAVTRLRDMGVEPFLLASTLRLVVAQRLVRRLCQHCREPVQADKSASALLGFDPGTIIYRAKGCEECGGSGYKGRIGVFEAIRVDDTIRRLINDGGDESLIARHAFLNAPNLGSAARALVRDGQTTAEEAIRVSRRDAIEAETISDG